MNVGHRSTRWLRAHPSAADVLLTGLALTIAVLVGLFVEVGDSEREIGGLGWTLIVVMNLPIAFRRRYPIPALWATVALTLPFWILDYPDDPAGPNVLIAIYSLAAHGERPRAVRHFSGAVVVLVSVLVAGVLSPQEDVPWFAVPGDIVVFFGAWILGDNLRTRREYLAGLEAKAAMTERQREAEARRAVNEERTRIARELHDVVAHSMSVMVVQAGAARRVIHHDPDQAAEALRNIEETGRESLEEMRRVLGVLRGDDETAELVPAPSLDGFDRLLQQCEESGMPVDLVIEGDVRRLATGVELSAYRIVQESLTNSLKHAGPARATVRLDYGADMLEVQVTDDGRGAAASPTGGSGQGLVGMRERVEAFGGTLDAGPRPGGGYQVAASFPLQRR